jgi:hypothetical protein
MTTAGALTWEFSGKFDQRAADYLADRYERQGYKATADAVRLGMPSDHEDHVVLVAVTEFLSALPEAPAVPVVKALEWFGAGGTDPVGVFVAPSILGTYMVWPRGVLETPSPSTSKNYGSIEAAKAAAQADFEARIRSALQSSPPVKAAAVDGEVQALRNDIAEFMRRLGPLWLLEQNWFPATQQASEPTWGDSGPIPGQHFGDEFSPRPAASPASQAAVEGADKRAEFHFWVDARRFTSEGQYLTGSEIKEMADTNRLYPLYRDTGPHFSSHEAIGDGVLVDIDGAHFYALIPATWGTRVND